MINKNSSHPELDSGSRRSIKAFTLIELLVVVLIIGILTAVAVPMYKHAVLKSRFSTFFPLAKNLWEGNEIFYLNNGEYAVSIDELDVSAPVDPKVQVTLGDEESHKYVQVSNPDISNRLKMYQTHSPNFAGETHCEALLENDLANWLCEKGLEGSFVGNKFGYAVYSLSPDTVGTLARTYYDNPPASGLADGDKCVATSSGKCSRTQLTNGAICDGRVNYGCIHVQVSDHSICYGGALGCGNGGTSFTNASTCVGVATGACGGGYQVEFSDHSSCVGDTNYDPFQGAACHHTSFSDFSACFGLKDRGNCIGNNFTDHSFCVGQIGGTCQNGDFQSGSICYANVSGVCANNTYDATSCCAGGANCPNEADRCETKGITVPPQPTLPTY